MTSDGRDYGRELYPFLYEDRSAPIDGGPALLAEVRSSTADKARAVIELRRGIFEEFGGAIGDAARAMAGLFERGGTLLAFGNGGSATDAADAVSDCLAPPLPAWRSLAAHSLVSDPSIVTAIANDVGFDNVFSRQIIAYGRVGDIAVGFSTSGDSANVRAGLAQASRHGLLTIGITGYDGGSMSRDPDVDYCFIARSSHIPRIQEGHATIWHALLEATQVALGAEEPTR